MNRNENKTIHCRLIVIGASTGGPQILQHIFSRLPSSFPVAIAVVQHFEKKSETGFVEWLKKYSSLEVQFADDRKFPVPGKILIAPQGRHMTVSGGKIIFREGPKVNGQMPSVDVLFETAAGDMGNSVCGILLSGMGRDGARGCLAIKQHGGYTIVQDENSSAVYGMPGEAVRLDAASVILPYQEIPGFLADRYSGDNVLL